MSYLKYYNNFGIKDIPLTYNQSTTEACDSGFWRPMPLGNLLEKYHLGQLNVLAILASWIAVFFICLGSVLYLVPDSWSFQTANKVSISFFLTAYPPLIICNLIVFWFGFEWGFIPAYLSTFMVALASGLSVYWALLLGLAVVLELAVFALVYYSVPIPYDLRNLASLAFFVGISFIASMAGSLGSIVWSLGHDFSIEQTLLVWKGWWTGTFLQTIIIIAPILYLVGNRVERLKVRFYEVPPRPALSINWIYGSIISVVAILSLFIWTTDFLGTLRLENEIAALSDINRQNILVASQTFELTTWITIALVVIAGLGGIRLVDTWNDILKKKVDERTEQFKASQKRFQSTFEQAAVGLAHLDLNGQWKMFNQKLCDITGYDKEELLTRNYKDITHSEDVDEHETWKKELLNGTADTYKREKRYIHRNGSVIWVHLTTSLVKDTQGNPEYFVSVIEDITERKHAEQALKEERSFSNSVINSLPGIFYLMHLNGSLKRWNQNLEEITGLPADDLQQIETLDLFHEEDRPRLSARLQEARDHGVVFEEARLITRHGGNRSFLITGVPFNRAGKQYMMGVGIDITQRKNYEKRIQESLKDKNALLAEIHHRVKNNLALISGLIELQIYNSDNEHVERVLKESQSRIYSMALVHEHIYELEEFADVKIDPYLKKLIGRVKQMYKDPGSNIKLEIKAYESYLPLSMAVPFGLLLNELLSNSFKHAFPEGTSGNIKIHIQQDEQTTKLEFSDNGIGLPDHIQLENPETLGLMLVQKLKQQLKADLTVETPEQGGTTFNFTFEHKK